jgi:hypothetical protein
VDTDASAIQPRAIAERVEEVEARQWEESHVREDRKFRAAKDRRMSGGLNTHFLEITLAWPFDADAGRATPAREVEQRRNLVQAFWVHEAWCRTGSTEEEGGEYKPYKPMSPLGYKVAAELARLTAEGPAARPRLRFGRPSLRLDRRAIIQLGLFSPFGSPEFLEQRMQRSSISVGGQ